MVKADNYVAGAHALDPFEAGVALESATVFIENTGQGFCMFTVSEDTKQDRHLGTDYLKGGSCVRWDSPRVTRFTSKLLPFCLRRRL